MELIAKNLTDNVLKIYIKSKTVIQIPANGQYDLLQDFNRVEISKSDIPFHIEQNNIILNNGVRDFTKLISLRYAFNAPDEDTETRDHGSGKLRVHQTSRQIGTKTFFTGSGDDMTNPDNVGNGKDFFFYHRIGDSTNDSIYLDFNCIENETWLHEGYIIWKNAEFDKISLSIVSRVTSCQSGSGTDYNLYGGYIIVPSDGTNGTLEITSDITTSTGGLVYMPNDDIGENPVAFWNADWNSTENKFENITPAPLGDGRYNMFTVEVNLGKFVNRIPLLGNGFERLQSSDVDQIGHGMRFKSTIETFIDSEHLDHNWEVACVLVLHREDIT